MAKKLLSKKWASGCLEKRKNKCSTVDLKEKVGESLGLLSIPPIPKIKNEKNFDMRIIIDNLPDSQTRTYFIFQESETEKDIVD